jgi:hypothetical protein
VIGIWQKIRAACGFVVTCVQWVVLNKLALSGLTSAVLAVLNGVANGADPTTVALSVFAVFNLLTHLTVTPLAKPKAADGTPLVTYSAPRTSGYIQATSINPSQVVITSSTTYPTVAPGPAKRARGLLPSFPDRRDFNALDYLATSAAPVTLDLNKDLTTPLSILGNDQWGDCFWAAVAHAKQTVYNAHGLVFTPTTSETLGWYAACTGFNASAGPSGSNPTDRGTEPRTGLKWLLARGIIDGFSAGPTDFADLKAVIDGYDGGVILCWALPADAPEDGDWTRVTGPEADGHATQGHGYSVARIRNDTWAEAKAYFTPSFAGAYLQASWCVTFPGVKSAKVDKAAHAADRAKIR